VKEVFGLKRGDYFAPVFFLYKTDPLIAFEELEKEGVSFCT